ncbi:MAG TPA: ABC transporter substrate-binding protein [Candidatus Methylomirabilis sp.]|jgi:NitT/TauT family transport system substrate-binding protein
MKRSGIVLLPLLLVLASTAEAAQGQGQGMASLRIGVIPIDACTQIFVAHDRGFFEKRGLQVSLTAMQGGPAIASAISGGALDMGWSNTVSVVVAAAKGFDFQIVAPGPLHLSGNAPTLLVTRADSPLRAPRDLEGQPVSANELANITELAVRQWVKRGGANPDAVRFVEVPFPQVEAALKADRVKAAVVAEPFLSAAVGRGAARVLADVFSAISPRLLIASTIARKSWVAAHRDEARRFMEAIVEATAYINAHPEERAAILPKYTRLTAEVVVKITRSNFEPSLRRGDIQPLVDAALEHGLIKSPVNVRDLVADTVPLE